MATIIAPAPPSAPLSPARSCRRLRAIHRGVAAGPTAATVEAPLAAAETRQWLDTAVEWHHANVVRTDAGNVGNFAEATRVDFPEGLTGGAAPAAAYCSSTGMLAEPAQLATALAFFAAEGYLILRAALDAAGVAASTDELMRLIHTWPRDMPPSYVEGRARESPEGRIVENPGTPLVDIDPSVLSGVVQPAAPVRNKTKQNRAK
jgi:hypothetical protein